MTNSVKIVGTFVLGLTMACGASDVTPPPGASVPLVRLRSEPYSFTYNSGLDKTQRIVVRDASTWAAIWNQIYLRESPVPPLPSVDFSQDMIVVAALGNRNTGGYSILLDGASETSDHGVAVSVDSRSPGRSCIVTQAFTQPVDIARLPARDGPVTFVERAHVLNCQ